MRLPHLLLESPFFLLGNLAELRKVLGDLITPDEFAFVEALAERGLPPVTSRYTLAALFGLNPGVIWSMEHRTPRYYRSFSIPKGQRFRRIDAPRVALKIIQKWLSVHLERAFAPPQHVYGFVKGRSHIQAAMVHTGARWVFSVDIRDFFQTTPQSLVGGSLETLGFRPHGAALIASLTCLRGALAQGAPTSPVLSNICFRDIDAALIQIAEDFSVRVTRYADDIVFSSVDQYPAGLQDAVLGLFVQGPWELAEDKTEFNCFPQRLKVHGLLVHGEVVRLTKGYRHRLRAYRHLLGKEAIRDADVRKVTGHLRYGDYIERLNLADAD